MDKIQKQRSSIVLYREKVNGERYIRIKYANNPAIALLLSREIWGIERSGFFNGREKWAKGFENQRV